MVEFNLHQALLGELHLTASQRPALLLDNKSQLPLVAANKRQDMDRSESQLKSKFPSQLLPTTLPKEAMITLLDLRLSLFLPSLMPTITSSMVVAVSVRTRS